VIACQVENNVPFSGEDQVTMGRDMAWIRIERYYEAIDAHAAGPLDVRMLPMLCQHCGNAPCEPVCPVFASYHTPDGLNAQVYNRCIGTRYCANACPYNARFFDFFNPAWDKPLQLQLNPDVSLRSVGVMEKCTFCVQRIKAAKTAAAAQERELQDGELNTACAQACPSKALVFGDLEDPESAVSRLFRSPRGTRLLEDVGTKPNVAYMPRMTQA
jgi:molybdopterin-containing oxidoreductase family iron-sulfur binding subunit